MDHEGGHPLHQHAGRTHAMVHPLAYVGHTLATASPNSLSSPALAARERPVPDRHRHTVGGRTSRELVERMREHHSPLPRSPSCAAGTVLSPATRATRQHTFTQEVALPGL